MLNVYLLFVIVFITILFVFTLAYIYHGAKDLDTKLKNWKVKHRLDKNGYLQYSIDGKLWTYIMAFNKNFNYGTYVGPGFGYLKFTEDEKDEYKQWTNMLRTIQDCHEWNKNALENYRKAIDVYINENK